MSVSLVAATLLTSDPHVASFWAALLGRPEVPLPVGGVLLPGDEGQVGLLLTPPPELAGPHTRHLHLTSANRGDQERTVERVLELGGRHIDVGQAPDEDYVVLADPGGQPFCVIEHGNPFLADCGFLGEVTCEGTHEVGVFWSEALEWPLVWDRDGETAVQSPGGGTKISWGGYAPAEPEREHSCFLLTATDPKAEAQRLVTLGAEVLEHNTDTVQLADPSGARFTVAAGGDAPRRLAVSLARATRVPRTR